MNDDIPTLTADLQRLDAVLRATGVPIHGASLAEDGAITVQYAGEPSPGQRQQVEAVVAAFERTDAARAAYADAAARSAAKSAMGGSDPVARAVRAAFRVVHQSLLDVRNAVNPLLPPPKLQLPSWGQVMAAASAAVDAETDPTA